VRRLIIGMLIVLNAGIASAQSSVMLRIEVRSDDGLVRDADVVVNGKTYETDAQGITVVTVRPGRIEIVVVKSGFAPASITVDVRSSSC
jgi:uncharacterized membrane protein